MLNENFRLLHGATRDTVGVAWTAPADDWASWLYVNGRLEIEAFDPGTAQRAIDIPFVDGECVVVEIHDFAPLDAPEETPPAIVTPIERFARPTIIFSTVADAALYRLYHRPDGEAETRIWEGGGEPDDNGWIALECPVELSGRGAPGHDGRWHFFRVEAVTRYGVSSQGAAWGWRVFGLSAPPALTVEAGDTPGRYTFLLS